MSSDPARVAVLDLLRTPGMRRPLALRVPVADLATSTAAVVSDEADLDLVVEALGGEVVVEGTVAADWEGACRRCLEPVRGRLEASVREIFERHPGEGDTYPLEDDHIDLGPLVREALLLALPLAPLCDEACRGPAPEAFPATVEGSAGEGSPADPGAEEGDPTPRDPRWAALDDLRFD
jgi:uncharacterized protein